MVYPSKSLVLGFGIVAALSMNACSETTANTPNNDYNRATVCKNPGRPFSDYPHDTNFDLRRSQAPYDSSGRNSVPRVYGQPTYVPPPPSFTAVPSANATESPSLSR